MVSFTTGKNNTIVVLVVGSDKTFASAWQAIQIASDTLCFKLGTLYKGYTETTKSVSNILYLMPIEPTQEPEGVIRKTLTELFLPDRFKLSRYKTIKPKPSIIKRKFWKSIRGRS